MPLRKFPPRTTPVPTPKSRHMEKLERAFFKHVQRLNNTGEGNGIGLDDKRPFGNSSVDVDVLEIIGATPEGPDGDWSDKQSKYAMSLYDGLADWLRNKYA